jgi:hypothetical protein
VIRRGDEGFTHMVVFRDLFKTDVTQPGSPRCYKNNTRSGVPQYDLPGRARN